MLAATGLLGGCGGPGGTEDAAPAPIAVRVAPVARETVRQEARYVGVLRSEREATVLARVAGTLARLPVAEGAAVRQGDLVASIEAPEQGARVRRASSDLARIREESEQACEQLAIDRRLHASGALAAVQLAQSETRCESSRWAIQSARSGVSEVREMNDKRIEHAPFDGRVLSWLAQPGEHVMPGRPLLRIGSGAQEVVVSVVEPDLRRGVRVGAGALLRLADGREAAGTVTEVAAASHGPARTLAVKVEVASAEGPGLPDGSSVDVAFVLAEALDAPTVPVEALRAEGEHTVVYVVDDGVARRRTVRVLVRAAGRAAIEGDLDPRQPVVVADAEGLADGVRVYPVPAERAP